MATEVKEFDPETAPLEELKARINADAGVTEEKKQLRDESGKFVAAEEKVEQAEEKVEQDEQEIEEQTIYQRRIDLGDGSGVQVFQANSMEELVDKLVKAQENATKKIREQETVIKKSTPPAKKERNADEEFLLSQEFMSKPSKAFERLFQEQVGMPIGEFKSSLEAVKAFNATKAADAAAAQFVEATPDYFPTKQNGSKIQAYLKTYRLPATLENITKAYTELNESGLLQAKPAEKSEAETESKEEDKEENKVQEVTTTTTVQKPKRMSSGLSTRGGAAPIVKKTPATQAEFEAETANMSLEEIRAKANSQSHVKNDPWNF